MQLINLYEMKKVIFTLISLLVCLNVVPQTCLYVNPDFDNISIKHKIIGIMPFKASVSLRPELLKDVSSTQLVGVEKSEGMSMQSALYAWFMKREKSGTLTVKVQDPAVTNDKLKKKGITIGNYEDYTPMQLAKILEVDAVLIGSIDTNMPMSEVALISLKFVGGSYGKNNKSTINIFIYNANDGELLINYNRGIPGIIASSIEELVNVLMTHASRRIAYTKK